MNVRKPVDYGSDVPGIDRNSRRIFCKWMKCMPLARPSASARRRAQAVAATEFLQAKFSTAQAFPHATCAGCATFIGLMKITKRFLRLAMKIGWTLNVVTAEAEPTRDVRKWYLEQALCRGWSKTQLLKRHTRWRRFHEVF
ncbi:MAG: hypothetical protein ACLU3I_08625 [Acutalibacteraceae bacterium]